MESFILARDDPEVYRALADNESEQTTSESRYTLEDSLWLFDGQDVKVWPDVQDLLDRTSAEAGTGLDACITITTDFYPFSVPFRKGIIAGAEAELTQRRDINFALFRTVARVR